MLMPVVVVTGTYVVFQDLGRNHPDPAAASALGAFFPGILFIAIMLVFYGLAIYHRRNIQLHSRYMLCTAFPMVTPGLLRVFIFRLGPMGVPVPGIFGTSILVGPVPVALLVSDKMHGRIYPPFVHLTAAWVITVVGYKLLPHIELWQRFTAWSLELGI